MFDLVVTATIIIAGLWSYKSDESEKVLKWIFETCITKLIKVKNYTYFSIYNMGVTLELTVF